MRTLLGLLALSVGLTACSRADSPAVPPAQTSAPIAASAPASRRAPSEPRRDLSVDESMGGHTLARHVGKSDADLAERLRRERQISAASSYSDRDTAERAVGAALDSDSRRLASWTRRSGRRPNLVLHYSASGPVGRSLFRGERASISCDRALVVLRWDERSDRFYVLTSYPDCER